MTIYIAFSIRGELEGYSFMYIAFLRQINLAKPILLRMKRKSMFSNLMVRLVYKKWPLIPLVEHSTLAVDFSPLPWLVIDALAPYITLESSLHYFVR